jgi:hypothetical protein
LPTAIPLREKCTRDLWDFLHLVLTPDRGPRQLRHCVFLVLVRVLVLPLRLPVVFEILELHLPVVTVVLLALDLAPPRALRVSITLLMTWVS